MSRFVLCFLLIAVAVGFASAEPRQDPMRWGSFSGSGLAFIDGVIKDDFLVNDDTTGGCRQMAPAVAMDESGAFVVAWTDDRNGEGDIYMQWSDSSGVPQGNNVRVNDDVMPVWQTSVSTAIDDTGACVVVWDDARNGDYDIYAQMFAVSGAPQGVNFRVSDDPGTGDQRFPAAARNDGGFIIAWSDRRAGAGNGRVYAQRYDPSGLPIGSNFRVDDCVGMNVVGPPSVAVHDSGQFVIAWDDFRNWFDEDVFAQRFDSSGIAQGSNFRVNDDVGTVSQFNASTAIDDSGRFVIAWRDYRNGDADVFAQRFDSAGVAQGSNYRVDDDPGTANQLYATMSMDADGGHVITWADDRDGEYNIYARRYDASGNPVGSSFRIDDDPGIAEQSVPSVDMSRNGAFVVAWEDERNGHQDIYAQRHDSTGVPQGSNFRIDDDEGTAQQEDPSAAMWEDGGFVVTWMDGRGDGYDIYAQMYDSLGTPVGSNFRVDGDTGTWTQMHPSVAAYSNGGFVVTWMDFGRFGWSRIDAQRFDPSGAPLGPVLRVSDTITLYDQYPCVATDASEGFIAAWAGWLDPTAPDIIAQRYDSLGNAQGPNFIVNDDTMPSVDQQYPSIAADVKGGFVVTWQDLRNTDSDIYAQLYDSSGAALGANLRVNDDMLNIRQEHPSVAMSKSGEFVVAWVEESVRDGHDYIYAQVYDSTGAPQGPNFRVNNQTAGGSPTYPSVAMDPAGGRFVVFWTDYRNPDGDPEVMVQKYLNGTPEGGNLQVNQPDGFAHNNQWSSAFSVAANSDRIAFAWMDNRRAKGWDIYGKLTDWDLIGIEEDVEAMHGSREARLMQNRPNPFSRSTTIAYSLSARGKTTLRVYDAAGRLVRTLVDTEQVVGQYRVSWDGADEAGRAVTSGTYFYRLTRENFTSTRKMILLR